MYETHFGLDKQLFDGGIARDVFMGPRQQAIAANFGVASSTLDSVIVLTGAAGVGKTTLAAAALRMTSTRIALAWLLPAPLNGAELLEALLAELGIQAHRVGRVERLQLWRQFLNEMNATETRVFVIAEHADAMDVELLRALEAITAADPNGGSGANLVLLGEAELNERLKAPALASLRQRVRLRQSLEPFDTAELRAYLVRRVGQANGDFERLFEPAAVTSLEHFSRGVPRAVNNLCETVLTVATMRGMPRVTAELVANVAVELFGLDAQPQAPARAPLGLDVPPQPAACAPVTRDAQPQAACTPLAGQLEAAVTRAAPAVGAAPCETPVGSDELPVLTDAIDARDASGSDVAPPTFVREAPPPVNEAPEPVQPQLEPAAAPPAATTASEPAHLPDAAASPATPTLEGVSGAMAETPFGNSDFDMLSTALASAGWPDNDDDDWIEQLARTTVDDAATVETPQGAFASFARRREPALSLVDDSAAADRPKAAAKG